MTDKYDLEHNPSMFMNIAKDIDLAVDKDENLVVVRRNNWGVSDERLVVGALSRKLIDDMIGVLQRLKIHAIQ